MILLMAVTGLSVVVIYQQKELAQLKSRPTEAPVAAASAADKSEFDTVKREVHQQLLNTCQNWQRWYEQDGKALSKVNRDNACRRSSEYGAEELGLARVEVSRESRAPPQSAPNSRFVRIRERSPSTDEASDASSWQEQLESLRSERE